MVEKRYKWTEGATLEDHSRRKHKILREYFFNYLTVRCQLPKQSRFRLAIVDGFAGGGRYGCGTAGSPIIFLEELRNATESVNAQRVARGLGVMEIECLLVLNDIERDVIEILKGNVAPLYGAIKEAVPELHLRVKYLDQEFESAYPVIKRFLSEGRYRNVLFNLDQYGHRHIDHKTLADIMRSYPSVEVFYTFAIEALISFLQKSKPAAVAKQLAHVGLDGSDLKGLEGAMNKNSWLGAAERLVFEAFRTCAPFVSPFSINNPEGWRYWLIHFANFYRARQVYNNILHDNSNAQAHFGRSGLDMLSFDPDHDSGALYLFDDPGRETAKAQLLDDIPRLISESGDVLEMADFYKYIYNETPAHADDVHAAIIGSPDVEVFTPTGGARRKANTIAVTDVLKLKAQKSFFPMFFRAGSKAVDSK
ncbi:MAG: three-Cys-motif partner protein TcmP [Bryobacterales bacterium]|nr:three-Cys-motif partner protein TcmP [Bryobacterales bacterium]